MTLKTLAFRARLNLSARRIADDKLYALRLTLCAKHLPTVTR